ncbi:FliH/SctL family protein [Roseateles sp. NT4]|uniref:FliH/SctL family protein n=1 Tax=Roseateles sp. NT4 TaxID=3453715 RepID=UPI003EEE1BF2
MNILKATHVANADQPRVLLGGAPVQMAPEAPREPGRWISEAELQALAERCLAQGREEGAALERKKAEATAREDAQRQAKAQLETELEAFRQKQARENSEKWRGLAVALAQQAQSLRDQLQAELTEWTFVAVCRLLGQQSRELVTAAVLQVLADAKLHEPLTVLLHAKDLAALDVHDDVWPAHVKLAADERIQLGGCLVQSAHQTLDARLEVQLELLRELLDTARLAGQAN